MKMPKRKKVKRRKDVTAMNRRWRGWRGMYANTSHLNGPVKIVKPAEPRP